MDAFDGFDDDSNIDWDSAFNDVLDGDEVNKEPQAKRRKTEQRLFPGPAGLLPKLNIESKKIATKLASIKDRPKDEEELTLSQMEKDDVSLTKEELIDGNKAWKACEADPLYIPENSKFNSQYILKESTEGVAMKIPIFFCVIKSMDPTSGLDISCELMDPKGQINGLIRREVIEDYGEELIPGTALILKVLSYTFTQLHIV